jgi:hypothetical protein
VGKVEIPHEWDKLILNARANPSPFDLVKVDTSRIYDIKAATDPFFLKTAKPPIKIKDVRIKKITVNLSERFLPWPVEIQHCTQQAGYAYGIRPKSCV